MKMEKKIPLGGTLSYGLSIVNFLIFFPLGRTQLGGCLIIYKKKVFFSLETQLGGHLIGL